MPGLETGRVVFAVTKRGVTAGVVVEASPSRLTVLTDSGGREAWGPERLIWTSEVRISAVPPQAAVAALAALRDKVLSLAASIDVRETWDLLVEEGGRTRPADVADILFSRPTPEQKAAVAIALVSNGQYFRPLGDGQYEPHSRAAVQAATARKRHEDAEEALIGAATGAVRAALAGEGALDTHGPAGRMALQWLKILAVGGDDEREAERGRALLERLDVKSKADPAYQAFDVLVRLGEFSPDEVLGIHRHRIRVKFPPPVLAEAERLASMPIPDEEMQGREVLFPPKGSAGPIALDDTWTMDVDDALMLDPGGPPYRVHVLIADPGAMLDISSAVAQEGTSRAATLYLPEGKIPMLPPVLSEGSLSLTEGEARPALDFCCSIAADGRVVDFSVRPVTIMLAARVPYDRFEEQAAGAGPLAGTLRTLQAIATELFRRRVDDGALVLQRDDYQVRVRDGEPVVTRTPWDSPGRRLVAEFMVLACTRAGCFARSNGIPAVYRKQSAPEDKLAAMGLPVGSRAHVFATLRTLKRAELTTQPEFHWGLGAIGYTQVTSPLRRFQDFLVHHQIKGFLKTGKAPLPMERLMRMFGDLEAQADILAQTEREARRYWLLKALARAEGTVVTGEVVAIQGTRAIVELEDFGLDLPVGGAGKLAPGTRVELRVHDVSPRRGRAEMSIKGVIP